MRVYDNIIIAEVDFLVIPEAIPYIIFDVSKVPITSFGLYAKDVGVEYVISQLGEIHKYKAVGVEAAEASCHWILPYVDSNTIKDKNTAFELSLFNFVKAGSFQTVFQYLKLILDEWRAECGSKN